MSISGFEQRRNDILQAIIEAYVADAVPVGSELISRKLRQQLSPATIRNVMAELEEAGYLAQPHTSAGRVPTDRGYRYYVDALMDASRLTPDETRRLARAIQPREPEIAVLLEQAGAVLSELTQQATFVVAPTVKHTTIRHIELMPLSTHKVLCVLVSEESLVASHMIEIEQPISRDEAVALVHFLNTELTGLPARDLVAFLERRLLGGSDSFYHLIKRSLAILQVALATEPDERLLIEGASLLFAQPEFHDDPRRAHELLRQLDLQDLLMARLREDLFRRPESSRPGPGQAAVRIGREVGIVGFDDCSYILAPFGAGQSVVGGIGVLGPRRMDYRRLRAMVEGTAGQLSELLGQWTDHGDERE